MCASTATAAVQAPEGFLPRGSHGTCLSEGSATHSGDTDSRWPCSAAFREAKESSWDRKRNPCLYPGDYPLEKESRGRTKARLLLMALPAASQVQGQVLSAPEKAFPSSRRWARRAARCLGRHHRSPNETPQREGPGPRVLSCLSHVARLSLTRQRTLENSTSVRVSQAP